MRKKKRKIKEIKNMFMFGACTIVSGAAAMFGMNVLPVMAAESVGEEMVVSDNVDADAGADTAGELSENPWGGVSKSGDTAGDENLGVYDFKDNKTTGTVTVTKVWDDDKTNEERAIPDIKISTAKPSKSALGYMVTFHGDKDAGLVFDDGSDVNEVVYNSSGNIIEGSFKAISEVRIFSGWYSDKKYTKKIEIDENGLPIGGINDDLDLYAKTKTFEIKGYNGDYSKKCNDFNYLIPDSVTSIIFTDEIKPVSASAIDVDADGDGCVVAWTENNRTVMKVSTQIKGVKVQTAKNSSNMFYQRRKLTNIDLSMLDTSNVTDMNDMFNNCSSLTSLDLTPLDTSNVTGMFYMFSYCSSLTSLDLTPLDTQNVTDMRGMFNHCSGLTSLDLTPLDTSNVMYMGCMFADCKSLTNLDLNSFDTSNVIRMESLFDGSDRLISLNLTELNTSKVKYMNSMFSGCSSLTSLDLSQFDTSNVIDMSSMFDYCSGLTSLDLNSFNTSNVTKMSLMFRYCNGLTSINLDSFNTSNVTDISQMFNGCSSLTALNLSSFDTQNVADMSEMFSNCSSMTSLNLSSFDTQKVTDMNYMFYRCNELTTLTTGPNFKFVGTIYYLSGTWQNTAGETFTSGNLPSNVADTYTKISS